jgi:aspartyl-tRNA(Asn)/glutamyl-tRNA(Gln) amidotransferase subunit B
MAAYTPTIGLEIHAELKTETKMFCGSRNDPLEERPNTHVCPICLGHPGTLPVVNRAAVTQVLRMGAAIGGTLADYTEFDRKNYFYPDLPKGYQISQLEYPLVKGGALAGVQVTRIHLEEDTATSRHQGAVSLVDFNRAGVPLMELVTEPVIHDAKTASNFARELQLLLRTLGAGDANMERGEMRVEANISVSQDGTLGTKTEVKNLNSFRSVERAIEFEVARQIQVLESGGTLVQETRGFNEETGQTFSQRLKESSDGYRYFPDPDIPKFKLSLLAELSAESIRASLPELPEARRTRYASLGLKAADIEVLVSDTVYQEFFETEVLISNEPKLIQTGVNYLLTDVRGSGVTSAEIEKLRNGAFASLIGMIVKGELSSRGGKDVLEVLIKEGGQPTEIASRIGAIQDSSSDFITRIAEAVISSNANPVAEYRSGKTDILKFLVGQGMKESKGKVNPELLSKELQRQLDAAR